MNLIELESMRDSVWQAQSEYMKLIAVSLKGVITATVFTFAN